jgi:hypothetical protein
LQKAGGLFPHSLPDVLDSLANFSFGFAKTLANFSGGTVGGPFIFQLSIVQRATSGFLDLAFCLI